MEVIGQSFYHLQTSPALAQISTSPAMKIFEFSKAEPVQGPQETRTEGQVCLYKMKPHCPGHIYSHNGDTSKLPPEPEETETQWPPPTARSW